MAVTLDSGLPFHLSRGDQERETSRLSLRHSRRFNDKRHSWTTDCHPLSSCGINKRRRVSDRTSLSSFFPSFSPFLSYYRIQGTYPRRQVISSCDNTTVLWSFFRLSEQHIPILVIEYKVRYDSSSVSFLFFFIFLWNIKTMQRLGSSRNETTSEMFYGQWGIRDDSCDGFCITKSRTLEFWYKLSWRIQFVNYYWIDCLNDALEIEQQLNLQVSTSIVDPFYLFND